MNSIELTGVSKRYELYPDARHMLLEYLTFRRRRMHREFWALRDVTFSVPRGAVFGIIGDNGAGKSTLLRILAGSTLATAGAVSVQSPSTSLIDLATGFKPDFTGRENVHLNCAILGLDEAQTAVTMEQVLDFSELGSFIDYPLQTYSSGMVMRLAFAVAVSIPTKVLLVDEVIAVGDNYFQRKCVDKIKALQLTGCTVVIASHNLHAVKAMCHQVVWLRDGRAEALGGAEEVVARYTDHTRARECVPDLPAAPTAVAPAATENAASDADDAKGREIAIETVRILDAARCATAELGTGDMMTVEAVIQIKVAVESPAFGVAIHRNDNVYCFGPNTHWDKVLHGTYEPGRWRLRITYPALPLLAGTYLVSVGIFEKDHVVAYVYHDRQYSFTIRASRPDNGIVHIDHAWDIEKL